MIKLLLPLAMLLLLLWPVSVWAAQTWAWVKTVKTDTVLATQNSHTVTPGVTVASGNHIMIVAMRGIASDTISSITSNASGATCTVDLNGPSMNTNRQMGVGSCYLPNGLTNTETVTVNWTAASAFNYFSMQIEEYSGLKTSGWADKSAGATSFRTQVQGVVSGLSASTTATDEMIFGVLAIDDNTETLSAGSGYTLRGGYAYAAPGFLSACEDKNGATTTTYEATGSWVAGNKGELGMVVTYIQAVAAGTVLQGTSGFLGVIR